MVGKSCEVLRDILENEGAIFRVNVPWHRFLMAAIFLTFLALPCLAVAVAVAGYQQ